jgi:tetratricopeptide (TPR) repeat protein
LKGMGDRAVDCARLESVCAARHQGFESPPIRFFAVLLLLIGIVASAGATEADLAEATREYQQEHFDTALTALERFEKSTPPTADSLDLRGCIYMEQQKFDEARKAFADARHAIPNLFAPQIHEVDLLLRQKKFAEARSIAQRLLRDTNVLMGNERLRFAILLSYLGEHDEVNAQKALIAIPFPTETPAYYYAQAAWALAHNKTSDAQKWMQNAAKLFEPVAPLWFARHLYDLGWLAKKPPLARKHD